MNTTLCRYFVHGVCRQGDRCTFSHDFSSKPSLLCKYYVKGNCSFGKNCRYDHNKPPMPAILDAETETVELSQKMTTLKKNPDNKQENSDSLFRKDTWMNAKEFIPGRKSHDITNSQSSGHASYATAANIGVANEDLYYRVEEVEEDSPICPYLNVEECPNGNSCDYFHLLQCDVCGEYCLDPLIEEQRIDHRRECLDAMEREMEYSFAVQRSTGVSCSICLDVITEKQIPSERKFGIMENCTHPFCLDCIRKWRGSGHQDTTVLRACPICRSPSGFITPSDVWVEDSEEKKRLIERYQEVLSKKACRYFDEGKGRCPFGSSCFYKHAFPDGSLEPKSPNLRFYSSSDCDNSVIRDHNLWQFIEARDLRPYET